MDLDLTTFALEIVNFLTLLWLLHRFLYKPMQQALQRRAEAASAQATAAAAERAELQSQAAELTRRATELDARRDTALRELAAEVAAERERRRAALAKELADEREKARARIAEEQRGARERADLELRSRAARFVATYLARLASPAVETAVVELFLADLAAHGEAARAALCQELAADEAPPVDVCTAYEPPPAVRERVDAQVRALLGGTLRTRWRIEPALLAGICVHLPGHQLEASLRRGIDAFEAAP